MNIEIQNTVTMKLSELDRLDPITVYLEDLGPRQGKIAIECYGKSWSSYWGGMGDRTIAQFFCSCDEHYLAKNLAPGLYCEVIDYDRLNSHAIEHVHKLLREHDIEQDEHDELIEEIELDGCGEENYLNHKLLPRVYGDDYWHSFPTKQNPDYLYLCRIILAVQQGLRTSGIGVKEVA